MLVLGRPEPGTWVRELDVGENMGGLGGTWLAPGRLCEVEESSGSLMWENTQSQPVNPSKASAAVVWEHLGAFELSASWEKWN